MLVREAMTTQVVTVTPTTDLRTAAALLAEHRITAMPVVEETGRLVGWLSEADVLRDSLIPDQRAHLLLVPVREGPQATYVGQVMSTSPVSVRPDADLADAVRLMTDGVVKSLPVVQSGRLVGVVSRADVVRQLTQRDDRVRTEIGDLVRGEQLDWMVEVQDGVVVFDGPRTAPEHRLAYALAGSVRGVTGVRVVTRGT